uniref:Tropomyosin n=1 Tax=Glossina pallidipes TaxID=7398 RepID=A0A1A9ZHG3_GLOPL
MDAIKKKMQAMKLEKDNAIDKAGTWEAQARDANSKADKLIEELRDLEKELVLVEADLVSNKEHLEKANHELEEKEKLLTPTESKVATLDRKVQQIEEDLEKPEERSTSAQQILLKATQAADENNRLSTAILFLNNNETQKLLLKAHINKKAHLQKLLHNCTSAAIKLI